MMDKTEFVKKSKQDPIFFLSQVLDFKPHDYQREAILDSSKNKLLVWGRQSGKSTVIKVMSIYTAFTQPNSLQLILSPSLRQSVRILKEIKTTIETNEFLKPSIDSDNWSKTELELDTGSRIISLPDSISTILGYSADVIYIDEAAHFKDDSIYYRAVKPMLIRTGGNLWLISTPLGKRGFFWECFSNWKSAFVSQIKSEQCPSINKRDLEKDRNEMDELTFRQEYNAEFLEEKTAYFPYSLILPCVQEYDMVNHGKDRTYFVGCDFAKLKDFSVFTVVQRTESNNLKVFHIERFNKIDYSQQLKVLDQINNNFRPIKILVDQTGLGEPLFEEIRDKGLPVEGFKFTKQSRLDLLSFLRNKFENKKLIIPNDSKLINELRNFKFSKNPHHDDMVMSLALCVFANRNPMHHVAEKFTEDYEVCVRKI